MLITVKGGGVGSSNSVMPYKHDKHRRHTGHGLVANLTRWRYTYNIDPLLQKKKRSEYSVAKSGKPRQQPLTQQLQVT